MTIATSMRSIGANLGTGHRHDAAIALFRMFLGRSGRRRPTGLDGLDDRMLKDIGLARRDGGDYYVPLDPWIERR
ncbi:hypothetical protein [Inquilinus sp. CAU 1745]|uniref:hypothetical protein n=1 Tax=Inquilinus sp. CAU 1745 TaxID=3140369 RepID=UPI00325B2BEA